MKKFNHFTGIFVLNSHHKRGEPIAFLQFGMSTRKGGERSRAPAHQNRVAFRHNKNSKKTAKIASMPIYRRIGCAS